MKTVAAALTLLALVTTARSAEPKHDIQGYSPGIGSADLKRMLLESKCEANTCSIDGGILQVRLTKQLPDEQVEQVAFRFKSGLQVREMIDYVSKQYGSTPRKQDIGDIGHAMGRYEDLPIVGRTLIAGGLVCRWKLAGGYTLALQLETPGDQTEYTLFLTKDEIERRESAIKSKGEAAGQAARRAANRQPRF